MNEDTVMKLIIGNRIRHPDFGEGVIINVPSNGFISVFFSIGEKVVPVDSLQIENSRSEQIIENTNSGIIRSQKAYLLYQSYKLPLLEGSSALTSAKIDLLPHQVVLTHKIAITNPRRFLIADEVGLGKTIETALILREMASRGELKRALIIVPAGLVNNWHHELNKVFNLNFEIFGSEGDVTDRRSNAFKKHNFLIASIDTLKRRSRVSNLKDAPPWDLVIFDEAHHLTAYKNGGKIKKTENYKLAEVMRDLSRDMILLSATPHQGDNFRFLMLVRLLNPLLFRDVDDMIQNRHRLNEVIYRRTKADACRPDGSTLFARRFVRTESFTMSEQERTFYHELIDYLTEGFALAKMQGGKGRALGFVMTIFQKIAASSFAAVKRTLRKRLLALTVQEGIMHNSNLDIEERDQVFQEARQIIREDYQLSDTPLDDLEIDHILTDFKRKILTKIDEEDLISTNNANEVLIESLEDSVASAVELALPEERYRIKNLLRKIPYSQETKIEKLLTALGALWNKNPHEKIVIFATYLGTVQMIQEEIEKYYPDQGVTILKGGDHSAKLAAEKRFKRPDGPKVLISTAAGREGINLQFSRILFNFDLPWNPMDLEQRIGRIHRYGQKHTAQVYNLVLSDTLEGRIYLLLDSKLNEIGRTLGKVDELGNVAEDLRSQILGQLSEKLNYEKLYMNALDDRELKRTKYELEVAMTNAKESRKAVFELFQDLDEFNFDEYKQISDIDNDLKEIEQFLQLAVLLEGGYFKKKEDCFEISTKHFNKSVFTTNREKSLINEKMELMGLDHPLVASYISYYQSLSSNEVGIRVKNKKDKKKGIIASWYIQTQGEKRQVKTYILTLAVDENNNRLPSWERNIDEFFKWGNNDDNLLKLKIDLNLCLKKILEPMLQREMLHKGIIRENMNYEAKLITWIEVV